MKPTQIVSSDYVTTYGVVTTKGFLTAGKDQNTFQIALSFFATVMGAQSVTFPAYYASYAGWMGLLFYALSSGAPVVLVALVGPAIRYRWPEVCSLGDFVHYRSRMSPPRPPAFRTAHIRSLAQSRRFGPTARLFITCIVLFNMAMVLLSEYMLIGALFRDFVGSCTYPIISTTAVLSLVQPRPPRPRLSSSMRAIPQLWWGW
jgi:Na+/proline symporter